MHTIETKNGKITLRLPNFTEAYLLIDELGLDREGVSYCKSVASLSSIADRYIEKISIKGAKEYADLLASPDYAEEVNTILSEISNRLEAFSPKPASV